VTRYASAIQIVRPLESIAETQPQLQPALLRSSAIICRERFSTFALILCKFLFRYCARLLGARE